MQLDFEDIKNVIFEFNNLAIHGLKKRCQEMPFDAKNDQVHTVITALLARQTTLAKELAHAPQMWNGHSAPLFLRAMADVYITFAWILEDQNSRAQTYIEYGLGQAVLQLQRMQFTFTDEEKSSGIANSAIEATELWINTQKYSFLVNINVGSWSGMSTRKMAEESGYLDFYDNVYVPFSNCAHSNWYHVGRYNARQSPSPLHHYHLMGDIGDQDSDVYELFLVAKYLDKTFNLFDEKILKSEWRSDIQSHLKRFIAKKSE